MAGVLKTMEGSVSRSVYIQLASKECTLFAHGAGHRRTVVVRIVPVRGAAQAGTVGKRLKSEGLGTDGKVSA
jgi:hypothetical protein